MATKGVLIAAIRKLEHANRSLRFRLGTAHNKDKEDILNKISRNEAMILDFNFRLKHEA